MKRLPARQRGVTLLIGLIMLVLMTLLAVTAFNLSKSNFKVVSNMQYHEEVVNTAHAALEEVLSRSDFTINPTAPFPGGIGNVKSYDVNGRANAVTVTVGNTADTANNPPPCVKSYEILPKSAADTAASGCASSVQQQFGVAGGATWGTQCARLMWEVTAVATDNTTGATTTVVQGIEVTDDAAVATDATKYCQ